MYVSLCMAPGEGEALKCQHTPYFHISLYEAKLEVCGALLTLLVVSR